MRQPIEIHLGEIFEEQYPKRNTNQKEWIDFIIWANGLSESFMSLQDDIDKLNEIKKLVKLYCNEALTTVEFIAAVMNLDVCDPEFWTPFFSDVIPRHSERVQKQLAKQ
jgi:hypothetical protein